MSDFAKNLKKYRKAKNLTQTELGKLLNYGSTAIANYESGRNEPSFDDLLSLCRVLGVTPNDLFGFFSASEDNSFLQDYKKLSPNQQKLILEMIHALQS